MNQRIVQILGTYRENDSVSRIAVSLKKRFEKLGIESQILAQDSFDSFTNSVQSLKNLNLSDSSGIYLFHSYGLDESPVEAIAARVAGTEGLGESKKVLLRHFSPSPDSLAPFSRVLADRALRNEQSLRQLHSAFQLVIADSLATQEQLQFLEFLMVHQLPFWNLEEIKSQRIESDGRGTEVKPGSKSSLWLVNAPILPHERIEDVLRLFTWYKQRYQKESQNIQLLILGEQPFPEYPLSLRDVAHSLKIQRDVLFSKNMTPMDLEAVYSSVDLFISWGDEGPMRKEWIDAALRGIPLLLFESPGAREFLGGQGVFAKQRDIPVVAGFIQELISDQALKSRVVQTQKENAQKRISESSAEKVVAELTRLMGLT